MHSVEVYSGMDYTHWVVPGYFKIEHAVDNIEPLTWIVEEAQQLVTCEGVEFTM